MDVKNISVFVEFLRKTERSRKGDLPFLADQNGNKQYFISEGITDVIEVLEDFLKSPMPSDYIPPPTTTSTNLQLIHEAVAESFRGIADACKNMPCEGVSVETRVEFPKGEVVRINSKIDFPRKS